MKYHVFSLVKTQTSLWLVHPIPLGRRRFGGAQASTVTSNTGTSGVPRNCVGGGSTNSVEDRGQRERGSGGGSPPSQGFWRQL